jgi:hypothetical protein
MTLKSDDVLSWLVPAFLAALLAILGWMAVSMNNISTALGVVVYRVDNHEIRIDQLEHASVNEPRGIRR